MSAVEFEGLAPAGTRQKSLLRPALSRLWQTCSRLWQTWLNHREARRTLHMLRNLDARTLRDMGFEPAEIYGTRLGTIGEIHGDAWKGLDK